MLEALISPRITQGSFETKIYFPRIPKKLVSKMLLSPFLEGMAEMGRDTCV